MTNGQIKDRRGDMKPAAVAAIVAIVSTAALFFLEFSPKDEIHRNGTGMITATVAARAGANVLPTEPSQQLIP